MIRSLGKSMRML